MKDVNAKVFCVKCAKVVTFKVSTDAAGKTIGTHKCGYQRYLPTGHCADASRMDIADQMIDAVDQDDN